MGKVRVAVLPAAQLPWTRLLVSSERVWANLSAELPGPEIEIVTSDPDVWLWDFLLAPLDSDKPIVAVLHEAPGDDEGLDAALVEGADATGRLVSERAERVVTCSSASRARIAERYEIGLDRIDLAPYGVDTTIFRPDGPTANEAILAAGGDSRPYVLFVGTILPRKNLPLLREAMVEFPDHQLVLVAAPALHSDSAALLEAAVEPIGGRPVANLAGVDVHQLAAVMRGAEALCLPSLFEGFGLPVVEAMACGTPVVVSDRGSLPEVTGDGGVVVTPTSQGIVGGLQAVMAMRRALSEKAQRRAQQFTWSRTAEIVRESLVRAAAAPTPHRQPTATA